MQVSVIIPVYNAENFVETAVESALLQPETEEVLLIEDGSPDNSLRLCRELSDKFEKVHLLQHPDRGNHGAGASRNLGINNARFEFIAFLDADDFYLKNRFKTAKSQFEKYHDIDGVYEAIGVYAEDRAAEKKWNSYSKSRLTIISRKVEPDDLFFELVSGKGGTISLVGLVVKKNIFKACGLFDTTLKLHQDTAMVIKMSLYSKLVAGKFDQPVAMRRVHSGNRFLNEKNKLKTKSLFWKKVFQDLYSRNLDGRRLKFIFLNYLYSNLKAYKVNSLENTAIVFFQMILHPFLFLKSFHLFIKLKIER